MDVTLSDGRVASYEVIGSGSEPLLTFVGRPGLSARGAPGQTPAREASQNEEE